jgi:hypothetical protein
VAARLWTVVAVVALALAASVQAASAGSSCNYGPATQPFARWGDLASYTIAPGGSFEAGAPGWALTGGARVVDGNESYYVRSRYDRHSLVLPPGSTATTAPFCVSLNRPTIRFFARNSGSSASQLRVRVVFRGLLGVLGILDGGKISAGSSWSPSPVMLATLNAPLGTTSAQFVFTPLNATDAWRIDDFYVDPWVNPEIRAPLAGRSVRWRGLEPPRAYGPQGPQPCASTNSATSARAAAL